MGTKRIAEVGDLVSIKDNIYFPIDIFNPNYNSEYGLVLESYNVYSQYKIFFGGKILYPFFDEIKIIQRARNNVRR